LENLKGRDHSADLGVDGRMIDLREIGFVGLDWVHLALVRDRWRALVNTVRNIRVP
jgi:hypothetical protein